MGIFYANRLFYIKSIFSILIIFLSYTSNGQEFTINSDIRVHLPADYESNPGKNYPMLIDLHGAGNIGKQYDKFIDEGPVKMTINGDWPVDEFIVVMPRLNKNEKVNINNHLWPIDAVNQIIEDKINQHRVDQSRIYMTGISLGAKGVWDYAKAYPDKLAAIVPIAGNTKLSGDTPDEDICNLTNLAVWALHGIDDIQVWPFGVSGSQPGRFGSVTVIEKLEMCNPPPTYRPRLTLVDGFAHNWFRAYYDLTAGINIYEWLLAFRKGNSANIPPFVEAGPDLNLINSESSVTLFGSAYSPAGDVNLQWTKEKGPSATLLESSGEKLVLSNLQVGNYTFMLTATDINGTSTSDVINLEIVSSAGAITSVDIISESDNKRTNLKSGITISTAKDGSEDKETFYFKTATEGSVSSVRYKINNNYNHSTFNVKNREFSSNRYDDKRLNWAPQFSDTYIITATPFNGSTPGVSQQYQITVIDQPLPVEFLHITAEPIKEGVKILWATASETKNDYFTIERSVDMKNFETVTKVEGAGNSKRQINYSYIDHFPHSGIAYYRVRQTDHNGQFDYSKIVSVNKQAPQEVAIFPNPLDQDFLTVQFSGNLSQSDIAIKLIDALGRLHYSTMANAGAVAKGLRIAPDQRLDKGLYLLILRQEQHTFKKRLIVN